MRDKAYILFAGWRCIVGGVVVVVVGAGVYRASLIGVEHFQGNAYARGEYVGEALRRLPSLLRGVGVGEHVVVVERVRPLGFAVRDALRALGYRTVLAAWAEMPYDVRFMAMTPFVQHLRVLGVTGADVDVALLVGKPRLAHWRLVRWLKGGDVDRRGALPARERWAKTGWATYGLWATLPYDEARARVRAMKRSGEKAGPVGVES